MCFAQILTQCVRALLVVCVREDANKVAIAAVAGAVELLVALLASPNAGVQKAAAGALQNLACNGAPLQQIVPSCLQCVGFIIAHAVVYRISCVLLKF